VNTTSRPDDITCDRIKNVANLPVDTDPQGVIDTLTLCDGMVESDAFLLVVAARLYLAEKTGSPRSGSVTVSGAAT